MGYTKPHLGKETSKSHDAMFFWLTKNIECLAAFLILKPEEWGKSGFTGVAAVEWRGEVPLTGHPTLYADAVIGGISGVWKRHHPCTEDSEELLAGRQHEKRSYWCKRCRKEMWSGVFESVEKPSASNCGFKEYQELRKWWEDELRKWNEVVDSYEVDDEGPCRLNQRFKTVVELKPMITSFGETLRQVNAYRERLETTQAALITLDARFDSFFTEHRVPVLHPLASGLYVPGRERSYVIRHRDRQAALAITDLSYEEYAELNGGLLASAVRGAIEMEALPADTVEAKLDAQKSLFQ